MEKSYKILNGDWTGYFGVLEKIGTNGQMVKLKVYEINPNTPLMITWFNSEDVELVG